MSVRTGNTRLPDGRLFLLVRMDPGDLTGLRDGAACCLNIPNTPAGSLVRRSDAKSGSDTELDRAGRALAPAGSDGALLIQAGKSL
jgi:hypothetical protein